MLSSREFNIVQFSYIINFTHNIVCLLDYCPEDKKRPTQFKKICSFFNGVIFKATPKFMKKLSDSLAKKGYYDVSYKQSEDAVTVYNTITGDWLSFMNYGT